MQDSLVYAMKRIAAGRPATSVLDAGSEGPKNPEAKYYQRKHRGKPEEDVDGMCYERYGRWVPGNEQALKLEDIVKRFIDGDLSYDEALAEALTLPHTDKRDFLTVVSRERAKHHGY